MMVIQILNCRTVSSFLQIQRDSWTLCNKNWIIKFTVPFHNFKYGIHNEMNCLSIIIYCKTLTLKNITRDYLETLKLYKQVYRKFVIVFSMMFCPIVCSMMDRSLNMRDKKKCATLDSSIK